MIYLGLGPPPISLKHEPIDQNRTKRWQTKTRDPRWKRDKKQSHVVTLHPLNFGNWSQIIWIRHWKTAHPHRKTTSHLFSSSPYSDRFEYEHRRASQHRTPRAPIPLYVFPQTHPPRNFRFCFQIHATVFSVFTVSDFSLVLFVNKVELRKQISCSLQLSNKTDDYVAFKVLNFTSLVSGPFLLIIWCSVVCSILFLEIWNLDYYEFGCFFR